MYRKFDVTRNLFLHSALFNGSKHRDYFGTIECSAELENSLSLSHDPTFGVKPHQMQGEFV
jgi:hypothetical protein